MRAPRFVLPVIVIAAAASAGSIACSGAADEPVVVRVDANGTNPRIIGGKPSTAAQDATVFLSLSDGFCSGSLITPNLVLTARHCVSAMAGNDACQHFTTDNNPTTIDVVLGANASELSNPTPAAHGIKLFHETNNSGCSYDIALIQLDHDLTGATLAPLRFTQATTSDIGLAIGYGDGDDNGDMTPGRYQRTGVTVFAVGPATYTYKTKTSGSIPVSVSPGELLTGESTCFGDSGGPLYDAAGLLIGVTSRGVDNYCIDRPSVWSDVYSHLAMIENAAMTAGHPLSVAPSGTDAGASSSSSGSSGTSGWSGKPGSPGSSGSSGTSGSSGSSGTDGTSSGGASSSGLPTGGSSGDGSSSAAAPPPTQEVTSSTAGGCSMTAPRPGSGAGLAAAGLGLAIVLAARRRRGN